VTTFPGRSGKWQVSAGGGNFPRWRRDGKEIFYLSLDNSVMAAAVTTEGTSFQVGEVQRLFEARRREGGYGYDVAPDGQRFLVNTLLEDASQSSQPLTLLVNWPALLQR
jgi:eukaryotic-like serine/threonine-protein kinase